MRNDAMPEAQPFANDRNARVFEMYETRLSLSLKQLILLLALDLQML